MNGYMQSMEILCTILFKDHYIFVKRHYVTIIETLVVNESDVKQTKSISNKPLTIFGHNW